MEVPLGKVYLWPQGVRAFSGEGAPQHATCEFLRPGREEGQRQASYISLTLFCSTEWLTTMHPRNMDDDALCNGHVRRSAPCSVNADHENSTTLLQPDSSPYRAG